MLSYARYLLTKGQLLGLTAPATRKPSAEAQKLILEIKKAADEIAAGLPRCNPAEIADLTDSYFLLYLMGYQKMPDRAIIATQRDRLFRLWKTAGANRTRKHANRAQKDKKSANPNNSGANCDNIESQLYALMLASMQSPSTILPPAQAKAYLDIQSRWLRDLLTADRPTRSFTRTEFRQADPDKDLISNVRSAGQKPTAGSRNLAEHYRRLALLLKDNLTQLPVPLSQTEFKERLYRENLLSDLRGASTDTLIAYRSFVAALFPAVLDYASMTDLDARILRELAARPDLSPYDHRAFTLIPTAS